jgi:hypothetical protein
MTKYKRTELAGYVIELARDYSMRIQVGTKEDSGNGFGRTIKAIPVWSRWYSTDDSLELTRDFPAIGNEFFKKALGELPRVSIGDSSVVDFLGVPVRSTKVNGIEHFNAADFGRAIGVELLTKYRHPLAEIDVEGDNIYFNNYGLANMTLTFAFFVECETKAAQQINQERLRRSLLDAGVTNNDVTELMTLARFDEGICKRIVEILTAEIEIFRAKHDGKYPELI